MEVRTTSGTQTDDRSLHHGDIEDIPKNIQYENLPGPSHRIDVGEFEMEVGTTSGKQTDEQISHEEFSVGVNMEYMNLPGPSSRSDDVHLKIGPTPSTKQSVRGQGGILKGVHTTRQNHLTPKAKHLYKQVINKSNKLAKLSARLSSFKSRLHAAEKLANSSKFTSLMHHVNTTTYKFILSQVRNQMKSPRARRYTTDEKVLALTILKASGRGYKLLSKIFSLPSKKTISTLLAKIPLSCGINKIMFESLGRSVRKMKQQDKMAILVFDEMSIESSVTFNIKDDIIEGLHDQGMGDRKPEIADHVNVFMLKGIFRQWKQPICYSFSSGPTKSQSLKKLIIDIVKECHSIGFQIVATVCDQGGPNSAAINSLLQDTEELCRKNGTENRYCGFLVDGCEIVPLYDPPHLFKGMRNNLLTKDLHFKIDNEMFTAKWIHLEQFYFLDVEDPERICPKLTDQHILRDKINKMKVRCCTQVFSHQVGALMKKILTWKSQVNLDPGAMDTSRLILLLDKLFDSLNSSFKSGPPGKPLKGGVISGSVHWIEFPKIPS